MTTEGHQERPEEYIEPDYPAEAHHGHQDHHGITLEEITTPHVEVATLEKETDLEQISHIVDRIRSISPEAKRLRPLIMRGLTPDYMLSGVNFPVAAKALQHYHGFNALPELQQIQSDPAIKDAEAQPMDVVTADTLPEAVRNLAQDNLHRSYTLTQAWESPLITSVGTMFDRVPGNVSSERRSHMRNLGQNVALKYTDDKKLKPEQRYSRSLWETILEESDLSEKADYILNGKVNPSDYDKYTKTSLSFLPETNGTPTELHQAHVEHITADAFDKETQDNPLWIIEQRTLSQAHADLTGNRLWDEGNMGRFQELVHHHLSKKYSSLTGPENTKSFIQRFYESVNPEGKRYISNPLHNQATELDPQNVAKIKTGEGDPFPPVDSSELSSVDKLSNAVSNIFFKRYDNEQIYLNSDEIIHEALTELGLDQADRSVQFDFLLRSAGELKGWLGAAKLLDNDFGQEDFKDILAVKVFTDAQLWKFAAEKQGWTSNDQASADNASLQHIHEYFKANPVEYVVRAHLEDKGEGWMYQYIEQDRPNPLNPSANPLESFDHSMSKEHMFLVGAKKLIEQGKVAGVEPSLKDVLSHEMYPAHQLFAYLGMSPEQVQTYYDSRKQDFPEDMAAIDRVRAINKELIGSLNADVMKVRYEALLKRDEDLRDRILGNLLPQLEGKEVEPGSDAKVMLVTCGDSRMEAMRAALENRNSDIETVGAAGHFGIPFERVMQVPKVPNEVKQLNNHITEFILASGPGTTKEDIQYYLQQDTNAQPNQRLDRLKNIIKGDLSSLKQLAADGALGAHGFYNEMKHSFHYPGMGPVLLGEGSARYVDYLLPLFAADMATFSIPGLAKVRGEIKEKLEKKSRGDVEYDVKLDAEILSDEDRERLSTLEQEARKNPDDLYAQAEYMQFVRMKKAEYKADLVVNTFNSIGLDENNWRPGENKVLGILGHGSRVSKNNPYKGAYDCGACGGNSGEGNAAVLASMINDADVQTVILKKYDRDISDITAVGGIYNTTTSKTEWTVVPDNEVVSEVKDTLFADVAAADDEALILHESLLKNKPVEKLKVPKWKQARHKAAHKAKEMKAKVKAKDPSLTLEYTPLTLAESIRDDASTRSFANNVQLPELGSRDSGANIYAPREILRGLRADEMTTTFHVNPATETAVPDLSMYIFSGVYNGIRSEYNSASFNRELHPGSPQEDYSLVLPFALESAAQPTPLMVMKRQMVEGRNAPETRPNVIVVNKVEDVDNAIDNNEQFKNLFDLGYGMLTVVDPDSKQAFTYQSPADAYALGAPEPESRWMQVAGK